MESFDQLKNDLKSDSQGRLWLDQVLVVIMPRWFFVDIMTEVEELAGAETAAKVYYQAGYKGAVKWCTLQMEAGLKGREVMAQYLNSATLRGWGRFEIVEFNEEVGRGLFRLFNSAVAEEKGAATEPVCIHLAGS
ncbi:MAG: hypothetical protein JRJ59_09320, partial [Deltaproteobacteria bacterium]|nr:hypothetical protein [Deltaproteobacteria bacterium]